MLSTQYPSQNVKVGPIATSYRSGKKPFGTCPNTCKLCDRPEEATTRIDHEYMRAGLKGRYVAGQIEILPSVLWYTEPERKKQPTLASRGDVMPKQDFTRAHIGTS